MTMIEDGRSEEIEIDKDWARLFSRQNASRSVGYGIIIAEIVVKVDKIQFWKRLN